MDFFNFRIHRTSSIPDHQITLNQHIVYGIWSLQVFSSMQICQTIPSVCQIRRHRYRVHPNLNRSLMKQSYKFQLPHLPQQRHSQKNHKKSLNEKRLHDQHSVQNCARDEAARTEEMKDIINPPFSRSNLSLVALMSTGKFQFTLNQLIFVF